MQHFVIQLNDYLGARKSPQNPNLTAYIAQASAEIQPDVRRKSVIVCPGGAYCFCSEREAEPVALQYVARGYNAFVLNYSVAPCEYPQQLCEVLLSVALVRRNADAWHCRKDAVAVMGFSAGGHLAASAGCLFDRKEAFVPIGVTPEEARPDAMLLCYPVITSGEYAHRGSFDALTGGRKELLELVSLEKQVCSCTPPAFLWHTADDNCVPVQNSLLFAQSMSAVGVPYALHIYPHGAHGLSLCNELTGAPQYPWTLEPSCEGWVDLSLQWLEQVL